MKSMIELSESVATTSKTRKLKQKTLPIHILKIIEARKYCMKDIRLTEQSSTLFKQKKSHCNQLTKLLKLEMTAHKEHQWTNFCESIHETHKFSADYWKKIKQISNQ